MTQIIAHRGYSKKYPENTILAFKKALAAGADGIELDILPSKDGQLVVHHDYYLGRTTDGSGSVTEKNLNYLKSLNAGKWFSKNFSDQKIPTLAEVFQSIGETHYEIELKGFNLDFARAVLKTVRDYNLLDIEFTSFHLPLLLSLKVNFPQIKIGYFAFGMPEFMKLNLWQEILVNDLILGQFSVLHCSLQILDEKFIDRLHKLKIKVAPADCNDQATLAKAFKLKVDQLSCDDTGLAVKIRKNW